MAVTFLGVEEGGNHQLWEEEVHFPVEESMKSL